MQKFAYIGTLTFNSLFTLDMKKQHIAMFHKRMSKLLRHTSKSEYWLRYVIEYHKVGNVDDPEAPHLHFILYSDRYLSGCVASNILGYLRTIGRSQFYLATTLKLANYALYIGKDVEKNDSLHGYPHDITVRLEEVEEELEYWESPEYYEQVDDDY